MTLYPRATLSPRTSIFSAPVGRRIERRILHAFRTRHQLKGALRTAICDGVSELVLLGHDEATIRDVFREIVADIARGVGAGGESIITQQPRAKRILILVIDEVQLAMPKRRRKRSRPDDCRVPQSRRMTHAQGQGSSRTEERPR